MDQQTRHLFLEAAFFTPELMAGRARQYGLHTDASHRYERGVDPELPYRAIERATALLLEWVGGNPGPVTDISATEQLPLRAGVTLRASALEAMLGIEVPADEVTRILKGLGFEVVIDSAAQEWCCTAPSWRFDMGLEADLIEESSPHLRLRQYSHTAGSGSVSSEASTVKQPPHLLSSDTDWYREASTRRLPLAL